MRFFGWYALSVNVHFLFVAVCRSCFLAPCSVDRELLTRTFKKTGSHDGWTSHFRLRFHRQASVSSSATHLFVFMAVLWLPMVETFGPSFGEGARGGINNDVRSFLWGGMGGGVLGCVSNINMKCLMT